jgi:hypothetical protein
MIIGVIRSLSVMGYGFSNRADNHLDFSAHNLLITAVLFCFQHKYVCTTAFNQCATLVDSLTHKCGAPINNNLLQFPSSRSDDIQEFKTEVSFFFVPGIPSTDHFGVD